MALFDDIYNVAATPDSLSAYLNTHMNDVNEFYTSSYKVISNEIDSVYSFVLRKKKVLRELSYEEGSARSFVLILLDLSTRFNLHAATSIVHQIIIQKGIICNRRLTAALSYVSPKPASNDDYIAKYGTICQNLQIAIDEEEDDSRKALATFLSYCATIVGDTNEYYIKELIALISHSIFHNEYGFLNSAEISDVLSLDFTDGESSFSYIQNLIDNLLGARNDIPVGRDIPDLMEDETEYANSVKSVNPKFNAIRRVSLDFYQGVRGTGRGVDILQTEEQLYEYMFRFGNMHKAKLDSAMSSPFPQTFDGNINIYDWGCGQGIASMVFLERYTSTNVNRVTLIEPSEIALARAALHVSLYRPQTQIRTICKKLDDLTCYDFHTDGAAINIHLFSNILDIEDYNPNQLLSLIDTSFDGHNYFVCTSPYIDDIRTERLDAFMRHFRDSYVSFQEISIATNPRRLGTPFWCCNNKYKGHTCPEHAENVSMCENRWTRVTRVFKV